MYYSNSYNNYKYYNTCMQEVYMHILACVVVVVYTFPATL